MAERGHQIFKLHRNERFVFDDQHAGRGFLVDFADGLLDQSLDLFRLHFHDVACLLDGKILERGQEQGLPVERRNGFEPVVRGAFVPLAGVRLGHIHIGAGPYLVEGPVERYAPPFERCLEALIGQGRLERGAYERVARGLRAGQCARITAQIRKVAGNLITKRHKTPFG